MVRTAHPERLLPAMRISRVQHRHTDGKVMLATQMMTGRKTLPHDIGHAFGLYHTFEGSADKTACPANTNCSTDGDKVCDTDPVYNNYDAATKVTDFSCRSGANTCSGTLYNSNTESNYMSYTTCYNLFTAGQKARLLASIAGAYRKSRLNQYVEFMSSSPALC